jgi:hypothetical protein
MAYNIAMKQTALFWIVFLLTASAPVIEAQAGVCDRACLEGFVNQYLDALVARDPTRLPLARNTKYTENAVELKLGDGMWGPKVVMGSHKLYFADPKSSQVGFYGSIEEHGHPAILVCHQAGDHARGQELAEKLAGSDSRAVGAAMYYAATGEADAMFEAFDAAYRRRDPAVAGVHNDPFFDPFRADPRFQALRARMNLD